MSSEVYASDGALAYGGYSDVAALYRRSTNASGHAASARASRSQLPLLITPFPWSAPLEEVRLKRP